MNAPATTRRYCEDCKFCDATPSMKFARCHAPQNILSETADHLVSRALKNEVTWRIEYCSSQRGPKSIGTCGTDANWFEPKDAEQAVA